MNRRKRMLNDLDQDIRDHIEVETQDNIARGMSPEERVMRRCASRQCDPRQRRDTRGVEFRLARVTPPGHSPRLPHVAQVPGLHGCRHPHPRSRHRREHGDIQCDQWSAAQSASLRPGKMCKAGRVLSRSATISGKTTSDPRAVGTAIRLGRSFRGYRHQSLDSANQFYRPYHRHPE